MHWLPAFQPSGVCSLLCWHWLYCGPLSKGLPAVQIKHVFLVPSHETLMSFPFPPFPRLLHPISLKSVSSTLVRNRPFAPSAQADSWHTGHMIRMIELIVD